MQLFFFGGHRLVINPVLSRYVKGEKKGLGLENGGEGVEGSGRGEPVGFCCLVGARDAWLEENFRSQLYWLLE